MATAAVIILSIGALAFFAMAFRFDYKNYQLRRKLDRMDGSSHRRTRRHKRVLRTAYLG